MNFASLFQRPPRPDPQAIADAAAERAVAAVLAEQQATREQMAAKLTEFRAEMERAQTTGMVGAPPPMGSRKVYARDYPWQYTIPHGPDYRPGQLVNIPTLRRFAQVYDIFRSLVNHLKDEVEMVPLRITARDAKDDSPATKARVEAVEAWFDVDGGLGGDGSTRSEFEKQLIEELFVIGPAAVYLQPTRGGGVFEALPIDASTIRPVVDPYGFVDKERAFEQWIMGIPQRGFKRAEMYYKGLYPRNDSPYPDSPAEYLCLTFLAAMSADTWNRSWLTTGTEPGRGMSLDPNLTPEQANFWMDLLDARLSGNIEQRQKVFFYPGGTGVNNNPTRRDHDFQEFMMWLARRCSAVVGVHLSAIGMSEGQEYATTQAKAVEQTASVGVGKVLLYLETFYNYLLRRLGYPDLMAKYSTEKEETAAEKADRVVKLTGVPLWTPNRGLQELGDDASTEPGADVLWVPTTYQPAEIGMNPPEPAIPGTAAGTESNGDKVAAGAGNEKPPPPFSELMGRVDFGVLMRAESQGGHFVTIGGKPIFIGDHAAHGSASQIAGRAAKIVKAHADSIKKALKLVDGDIVQALQTVADKLQNSDTEQDYEDGKLLEHLARQYSKQPKADAPKPDAKDKVVEPLHPGEISHVAPSKIASPHGITDKDKLASLTKEMKSGGWQGRPVLVEKTAGGYQAWTGSHRLEAAKAAGLKNIPVVEIDTRKLAESLEKTSGAKSFMDMLVDDEDRLKALQDSGDDIAASLMEQEVESNDAKRDSGDKKAQQRAELRRWERKALRRLKETGSPFCHFKTDILPEEAISYVEAALQLNTTAENVRFTFAEALEDYFPPVYHTSAQGYERSLIGRKWAERRLAAEREA